MPPDTNGTPETPANVDAGRLALAFVADDETLGAVRKCFTDLSLIAAHVERAGIDTAAGVLARIHSPKILIVDISGLDDPLVRLRRLARCAIPRPRCW